MPGGGGRALAVVAVAALLTAAAACGAEDQASRATTSMPAPTTPDDPPSPSLPTVGEVFRDTRTFALASGSGRVEGTLRRGRTEVTIELEGDAVGSNQHIAVEQEGAGLADVLTVDEEHWLAGDLDFWLARGESTRAARRAATGWHRITAQEAGRVAPWTLRTVLTERFARADVSALETDSSSVDPERLGGRDVWVLGRPGGPQLWVLADGSGELVRLLLPERDPADLTFSRWGRVEPLAPPEPDTVVAS